MIKIHTNPQRLRQYAQVSLSLHQALNVYIIASRLLFHGIPEGASEWVSEFFAISLSFFPTICFVNPHDEIVFTLSSYILFCRLFPFESCSFRIRDRKGSGYGMEEM